MANKVRGYRNMIGMTQKDLAEKLNVTPQSISAKEKGKRSFNDQEKVILLKLFLKIDEELTIDKLFF